MAVIFFRSEPDPFFFGGSESGFDLRVGTGLFDISHRIENQIIRQASGILFIKLLIEFEFGMAFDVK